MEEERKNNRRYEYDKYQNLYKIEPIQQHHHHGLTIVCYANDANA